MDHSTFVKEKFKQWCAIHFDHPFFIGGKLDICGTQNTITNSILDQVEKELEKYKVIVDDIKIVTFLDFDWGSKSNGSGSSPYKYPTAIYCNFYCISGNFIYLLYIKNIYFGNCYGQIKLDNSIIVFYELFAFNNIADTKIFSNSFRKYDGLFSDEATCYTNGGNNTGKTCTFKSRYNEYIIDIENYLKTFSGVFYYPLKDDWKLLYDPNGNKIYCNDQTKEVSYVRPSLQESEKTGETANVKTTNLLDIEQEQTNVKQTIIELTNSDTLLEEKINKILSQKLEELNLSENINLLLKLLTK